MNIPLYNCTVFNCETETDGKETYIYQVDTNSPILDLALQTEEELYEVVDKYSSVSKENFYAQLADYSRQVNTAEVTKNIEQWDESFCMHVTNVKMGITIEIWSPLAEPIEGVVN